jgi:hydroxymethylpyrimidine pyrophosphatase-like HAD family hydrolase
MRYAALATDGDGTLLDDGYFGRSVIAALKRWRADGRKLILVTGERYDQVCHFPHQKLFDRIIAENGAVLLSCNDGEPKLLADPPPAELLEALRAANIAPLRQGKVVIQTEFRNEAAIQKVLRERDFGWATTRNRKDLMLLPSGVTKATGLAVAADSLGLSLDQIAGVGDAENDGPLLHASGLGVAVENAVPRLKAKADRIMGRSYGSGVAELIDELLRT